MQKKETSTHFFIETVKSKMDKRGVDGVMFTDLKKEFDTISHDILISKLSLFNFFLKNMEVA